MIHYEVIFKEIIINIKNIIFLLFKKYYYKILTKNYYKILNMQNFKNILIISLIIELEFKNKYLYFFKKQY